jgi:hypothetical protein
MGLRDAGVRTPCPDDERRIAKSTPAGNNVHSRFVGVFLQRDQGTARKRFGHRLLDGGKGET